jgi:hypothetical protein
MENTYGTDGNSPHAGRKEGRKSGRGLQEFETDRVARTLGNARRGKAPYVGIPLQGCSPFILKRELLVAALNGIRVIDAGIQVTLPGEAGQGCQSYLQVYGVNEWGRPYMAKFYPQDRNKARTENFAWASRARSIAEWKIAEREG